MPTRTVADVAKTLDHAVLKPEYTAADECVAQTVMMPARRMAREQERPALPT